MTSNATFSACGRYRYMLCRQWDASLPTVCWIMLNPSTADGQIDDRTIKRVIGFSKREGYGGIVVMNLMAWVATNPSHLDLADDPVGPDNDKHLLQALGHSAIIVAWGGNADRHSSAVRRMVTLLRERELLCLGTTQSGQPRHPGRLPEDTLIEPWHPV